MPSGPGAECGTAPPEAASSARALHPGRGLPGGQAPSPSRGRIPDLAGAGQGSTPAWLPGNSHTGESCTPARHHPQGNTLRSARQERGPRARLSPSLLTKLQTPARPGETPSPCPIQARRWDLSSLPRDLGVSLPLSPSFAGVCLLTEAVIISSINLWRGFY